MKNLKNLFSYPCIIVLATFISSGDLIASGVALSQNLAPIHAQNQAQARRFTASFTEEYGFQIHDYPYDYQGEKNVLNIDVMWRYLPGLTKAQYPDVVSIKRDLEQFMQNYPNKMQYWEFLNKDASQMIMQKYHSLASLTVKFQISPNLQQPFARTSIVTLTR